MLRRLCSLLCLTALAQQPPDAPTLRITVTLVQLDAIVTDSKGNQVTDLNAEDFELRQDGKPQKITHFAYVKTGTPLPARAPAAKPAPGAPVPLPPPRLRPADVRRTLALIVDDLGLSFESTVYVRDAVKKFINQQVQPGDMVAIIRTGAGIGAMQQFTADKRLMLAAADLIKWHFMSRAGLNSFSAADTAADEQLSEEARAANLRAEEFNEEYFTVGTLGAIRYVVQGLRDMPGRKGAVIFSESMNVLQSEGINTRMLDALRQMTDAANRAGVVLYSIDPRGLQTFMPTAADRVGAGPNAAGELIAARQTKYFNSQDGLGILARETGGLFLKDTNDIAGALRQVVNDQTGYYLLGYSPQEGTFTSNKEKYHRVSIHVKRPGLQVRTRAGFFSVPDSERAPFVPRTRGEQIASAFASPFGASGIRVRLSSTFTNSAKSGSYVHSELFVDARNLHFTDAEDGRKKAVFEVVTLTSGEKGQEIDRKDTTYTLRVKPESFEMLQQQGLVYRVNQPVKQAGAFQMRAVVRDTATQQMGSASQFIEVPDLKKKRFALSGIWLQATTSEFARKQGVVAADAPGGDAVNASEGSMAVRRFYQGQALTYGYLVFNAQLGGPGKRPQVETRMRLFRDGKLVFSGQLATLQPDERQDLTRVIAGGLLRLGASMTPGQYVLQVVATDKLAKAKHSLATQSLDFEVLPRQAQ